MVAPTSNGNGNGNGSNANSAACPFSSETLSQQPSRFAVVVQRVEACLANMQGINERIAALVDQRRKVQDELREIQGQINEEFERILTKPMKVTPTKVVARAVKGEVADRPEVAPRIAEVEGAEAVGARG